MRFSGLMMLLGWAWTGYLIAFANMYDPANWVWAIIAGLMAFQPMQINDVKG